MSTSFENKVSCKLFDLSEIIPDFCIDAAKRKSLCFRENLLVFLKNNIENCTQPVGGFSISVEKIGALGLEFLVHAVSSMKVDGFFGGSKVIGSVTEQFHCLEEKRNEFIHREEGRQEKMLFIGSEDDFYHIESTQMCGFQKETQKKDLKFSCYQNLLSEGGNILLMRYLALTNFHGVLQFECVTIDGRIALCKYRCSAAQTMNYNNSCQEIYTIKRKIQEEFNPVQNTITYMTKKGRILKHDWLEVSYMLKLNPLIDLNKMENGEMPEKVPLRGSWVEDLELLSQFLDQKTYKMAEKAEYLTDHPELKNMIADYVQALLFVKPRNVLSFTIQHFLAFANETEPIECSSKLEDIGPQVFKLFGNLDLKSDRRDSVRSQGPGEFPTPTCPACSVCSSSSSQLCTKRNAHIFEKTDDSKNSDESESHEREHFEKESKSNNSSSDFEFRFED